MLTPAQSSGGTFLSLVELCPVHILWHFCVCGSGHSCFVSISTELGATPKVTVFSRQRFVVNLLWSSGPLSSCTADSTVPAGSYNPALLPTCEFFSSSPEGFAGLTQQTRPNDGSSTNPHIWDDHDGERGPCSARSLCRVVCSFHIAKPQNQL